MDRMLKLPTPTGVGQEPSQTRRNCDACETGPEPLETLASASVCLCRYLNSPPLNSSTLSLDSAVVHQWKCRPGPMRRSVTQRG